MNSPRSLSDKYIDIGLLVMRIGLGLMFIYHGAPKIFGGPERWEKIGAAAGNFGFSFFPAFWGFIAGLAEFGGGICIMLGIFLRPACALLIINLIIASSTHINAGQGIKGAAHAIEDAIAFAGLLFTGPGRYTVKGLFEKKVQPVSLYKPGIED